MYGSNLFKFLISTAKNDQIPNLQFPFGTPPMNQTLDGSEIRRENHHGQCMGRPYLKTGYSPYQLVDSINTMNHMPSSPTSQPHMLEFSSFTVLEHLARKNHSFVPPKTYRENEGDEVHLLGGSLWFRKKTTIVGG